MFRSHSGHIVSCIDHLCSIQRPQQNPTSGCYIPVKPRREYQNLGSRRSKKLQPRTVRVRVLYVALPSLISSLFLASSYLPNPISPKSIIVTTTRIVILPIDSYVEQEPLRRDAPAPKVDEPETRRVERACRARCGERARLDELNADPCAKPAACMRLSHSHATR